MEFANACRRASYISCVMYIIFLPDLYTFLELKYLLYKLECYPGFFAHYRIDNTIITGDTWCLVNGMRESISSYTITLSEEKVNTKNSNSYKKKIDDNSPYASKNTRHVKD